MSRTRDEFSELEARFIREYLVDLNASAAAKRAGYAEKSAQSQGSKLLKRPRVRAAIDEAKAERAKRTEINADNVLRELAKLAFSDIRKLFQDGSLIAIDHLGDDVAPAVAGVDVVTKNLGEGEVEYIAKIKLWDKLGALDKLGRHLSLFQDNLNLTSNSIADKLQAARERAAASRAKAAEAQSRRDARVAEVEEIDGVEAVDDGIVDDEEA